MREIADIFLEILAYSSKHSISEEYENIDKDYGRIRFYNIFYSK